MFIQKRLLGYLILSLIGLSMVACHFDLFDSFSNPASEGGYGTKSATEKAGETLVGAFDSGRALEILYGNYDPVTRRARWQPTNAERALFHFAQVESFVYSNVLMAEKYGDGENSQFLLLTRTLPKPDGCRDCSPVLGGAIFSQIPGGWQLSFEKRLIKHLEAADQWQGSIIRFSETKQGARLHWRFLNNGFAEEGDLLLAIEPNKFEPIFDGITGRNNSADCDQVGGAGQACWAYQSKLSFQPGSNSDYDDLLITSTGTKLTEHGEIVSFNETAHYTYNQGKYQLAQKTDRPIRPRL